MTTNTKIGKYKYAKITRTVGHKANGEPIKKQFYGSSKRDAENKYKEFLKAKEPKVVNTIATFGEALEEYVENILRVNSSYSLGTRELYEQSYNTHLKSKDIVNITLSSLTSKDLQRFYNELDISDSAIKTLNKFLRGFFKWCCLIYNCENITNSVVIPAKKVVKKSDEIVIWTDEEIENIMAAEPNYYLHDLIIFALYTGMRISELLGLKWEDIDVDKNIINVRRQYYRGNWCEPKGNKSRVIPMHEKIKEVVKSNNPNSQLHGLVFTTSSGTPMDYHNVITSLNRFYSRNGLWRKKFHAYRATFITNLCKNGVPIQTASKLAGHENITVTAKYYTSVDLLEMQNAIGKI